VKALLAVAIFCLTLAAQAEEPLWKKSYWGWGQGTSTSDAAARASQAARPAVAALRGECDEQKGIVSVSAYYGTCAKSDDPMFCKYGCYSCPVYGTASCRADNTTDIKTGALVEATADANLVSGNQVVGHVAKGDKFHVVQLSNGWASLESLDGAPLAGWIRTKELHRL
jgi:hypothetical protein